MHPAVFLDRDNTLIANDGDLGDPAAVDLLDGVPDGLRSLRDAGYRLIVVTNQGGVARGRYDEQDVDAVHQRIARLIDERAGARQLIDRFYYCPYHPDATIEAYRQEHPWRKPNPGMLLQAARDLDIDLESSWLIGDQLRDVQAGSSAGCRTILLRLDGESAPNGIGTPKPTATVTSFPDAVRRILETPAPRAIDPAPRPAGESAPPSDALHRAILDLTDELRTRRLRRGEFTLLRMAAGVTQLFALLLALQGLLHIGELQSFLQWFAGALLVQVLTLTILILDRT